MGIKMLEAFDGRGKKVSTTDCSNGVRFEPFTCIGCKVGILFVEAFSRERDNTAHLVHAFFRLRANVSHNSDCQFAVDKKVKVIADESLGIVESIKRGKYRFRLLALDFEDEEPIVLNSTGVGLPKKKGSRTATEFTHTGNPTLAAYLSTAKRILKLRALCDSDHSLRDVLELTFNGDSVSWPDFYYEAERYVTAFRWVQKSARSFPVAIEGIVRDVVERPTKKGPAFVMNLKIAPPMASSHDKNLGELGKISIWSRNKTWLDYKTDDRIVAFGHWSSKEQKIRAVENKRFPNYQDLELYLWPRLKSQIAKIE